MPALLARLRPWLFPLLLAIAAVVVYETRLSRQMTDFGVYRAAASRVVAAEPLYRSDDGHYQFKYLPAFALAIAPIAFVSADTAKAVWFALSFGLLVAFLRWSVRALPERRQSERTLLWITVLLMAKFYGHELTLGQTNVLLGSLLVAALLMIQIDQPLIGGALIGAAAFVKPYALVLLPWMALTQPLIGSLMAVTVVVAGLILPAALYGWTGNLLLLSGWYHTVTDSTAPNLLVSDNISFAAMWAKWLGPGRAATALAILSSLAALALAAAVAWRRRRVNAPEYLEFALLMLLVPLLSPQGWDYVLLLATPAVLCLVDRWRDVHAGWRTLVTAALVVMSFTIFDVMGRTLYFRFMMLSIVSVCALVVAIGLAHLRWRALA